jgi:hypothetical protein
MTTSSAALAACALVSWGAIIGYLFFLHSKITKLEKGK